MNSLMTFFELLYEYPLLICFAMLQIVELPNHPYFVGAQFHPEFKSRPGKPSPLFLGSSLIHVFIMRALPYFEM